MLCGVPVKQPKKFPKVARSTVPPGLNCRSWLHVRGPGIEFASITSSRCSDTYPMTLNLSILPALSRITCLSVIGKTRFFPIEFLNAEYRLSWSPEPTQTHVGFG